MTSSRVQPVLLWIGLAACLCLCSGLRAQSQISRFEIGGEIETLRLGDTSGKFFTPGFGAHFDVNLTPRLALESQIALFPQHVLPQSQFPGGKTFQTLVGIRAKVAQTKKFAVFGIIRPGLTRFSQVVVNDTVTPSRTASANYFTLNLGGGIEFYPTPHLITRFEIGNNVFRVPNFKINTPSGVLGGPGAISDSTRITAGVAYRLGAVRDVATEKPVSGNAEFGPEFTAYMSQREGALDGARSDPGFGGFFSYKLFPFFYVDSAVTFFPRNTASAGLHDGGTIFQGLFGIKGGIRRNRLGFFGKVRPGFHSYSAALSTHLPALGQPFQHERVTNFVEDLGGVIEFYLSPRTVLRFDAGDTHLYYATRKGSFANGTPFAVPGGPRLHSIQLSTAFGFRF